jgi:uncharacterized membrane protein
MRHRLIITLTVLALSALTAEGAYAARWQICNRTAEDLNVAIAYDPGNGRHVSKGWFVLKACGGCRDFGNFSVTGVWYRAEGANYEPRIEGNDIFCLHKTNAFSLGAPNREGRCSVSRNPNSPVVARGFRAVRLTAQNFTTNITGKAPSGRVCID